MSTRTPLTILVLTPVAKWAEELNDLRKAGHTVMAWEDAVAAGVQPHLIVGEAAWHMAKAHRGMLGKAVESARKRVKGRE